MRNKRKMLAYDSKEELKPKIDMKNESWTKRDNWIESKTKEKTQPPNKMERNWWYFQISGKNARQEIPRNSGRRHQTREYYGRRVCSVSRSNKRAAHVLLHKWVRKLFGQSACETCKWMGACGRWIAVYKRASKHRETHKEGDAWNVLMLGIQTTLITQIGRVARFKLPTKLALGKYGKLDKTLEIFLTFKSLAKPQIDPFPAIRAVPLKARFWFSYRRMSTSNWHVMIPAIGWVENRSRKQVSCIVQNFHQIGEFLCRRIQDYHRNSATRSNHERPQVLSHSANQCLERLKCMEPRPRPTVVKLAFEKTLEYLSNQSHFTWKNNWNITQKGWYGCFAQDLKTQLGMNHKCSQ